MDEISSPFMFSTSSRFTDKKITILYYNKQVCTALGLVTFLAAEEKDDTQASITTLAKVFSQGYLKGDGMPPAVTSEQGALYASALSAWALLITLLPANAVFALFDL